MITKYGSGKIVGRMSPILLFVFAVALSASGAYAAAPSGGGSSNSVGVVHASRLQAIAPRRPEVQILCVDNGNPIVGPPCTNTTAYSTIQAAVTAAVSGDEIRIASRVYIGSGGSTPVVSIGAGFSALTLLGGFPGGATGWATPVTNPDATQIDGQGQRESIQYLGNGNITVNNLALVNGGLQNDNGGAANVLNSFALVIRSGGTSSGTFSIGSGSSVQFTSGAHTLSSGTNFTGQGIAQFSGATVTIVGAMTAQNLDLTNGTLTDNSPSTITVSGIFNWNGGTMSSINNPGITNLAPTGTLHLGGPNGTKTLFQRTFNNNHNAYMDGAGVGSFAIGNGAVFNNPAGSNFYIQNNDSVFYTGAGSGPAPVFNNNGTVRKQSSAGASTFGNGFLKVINNGSIFVDTGILSLDGDPSNSITESGSYGTSQFATLKFNGGNRSMGNTSNVGGAVGSTTQFTAGTVTSSGTFSVMGETDIDGGNTVLILNGPSPNLGAVIIDHGGTLRGSSVITVNGVWHWRDGWIRDTTITNNGVLNIDGVQTNKRLSNATIINNGQAFLDGTGPCLFFLRDGSTFDNQQGGAFSITTANQSVLYETGTQSQFINRGTLNKDVVRDTSVLGQNFLAFDNFGTVNVITGTLSLEGGTLTIGGRTGHTGPFNVSDLSGLRFNSNTHTDLVESTSTITGTGIAIFQSGTVNIAGNYNLRGTGGTYVNGGTVNFDADAASSNITITSGLLSSNFTPVFTVSNVFKWDGGTVNGGGTISLLNTSNLRLGGLNGTVRFLGQRTFINRGAAVVETTGVGTVRIGNGAVFSNTVGASFDIGTNDNIIYDGGVGATFANAGTLRKTGGGSLGVSLLGTTNLAFNNYGTVRVMTGTLSLEGGTYGGTSDGHTGNFMVDSLCTLRFGSNNHTLQTSSSIIGAGNVEFGGGQFGQATIDHGGLYNITGITRITNNGTVNFNGRATSTEAIMTGGTLGGFGVITVTGVLSWTGGSMVSTTAQPGPRTTYIMPGATVLIGGTGLNKVLKDSRIFNNAGHLFANTTNASTFHIGNGATFNNQAGATFEIQDNESIIDDGGVASVFNNNGSLSKTGGGISGVTQLGTGNLAFNTGEGATVNVMTGTLSLDGGTSGGASGGHSGAFTVARESTLRFNGGAHIMQPASSIVGVGNVEFRSGSVTVGGGYNLTGLTQITNNGIASFTGNATTANASMTGGVLGGSGVFTTMGAFNWSSGAMNGSGRTEIPVGAVLNMGGGANRDLSQRTLNNRGTVNMLDTGNVSFSMGNGAVFNNSATFSIQNDGVIIQSSGSTPPVFNNTGNFIRSAGAGTTTVGTGALLFNNTGTVNVQTGVLNFGSTFRQTSGATLWLNGGHVTNSAPLNIDGGSITGSGVITGSVTNNGGIISPGGAGSAGVLTVNGTYIQGVNGTMFIEIGGLNPGLDTDKVTVTGPATLNGTIKARTINGFRPSIGASLLVLTVASRTNNSQFSIIDTNLGNGLFANPVYAPTSMSLVISGSSFTPTPTPPPGSTPTPTPSGGCGSFSDVLPDNAFYTYIHELACRGIISGYSDNTFRPGNNTTRGQLAKIVVLAQGWLQTCSSAHFTDVPVGSTFFCVVETAYAHGVISGYADGTFRPGNNVTRGQLSKIIVVAKGWGMVCPAPGQGHFVDVPSSDPFYCFIETAYSHGIISGYTCGAGCLEFRPVNNATRGQISKIVYLAITQ